MINTIKDRIYFDELSYEKQEKIKVDVIEYLKLDDDLMAEIKVEVMSEAEIGKETQTAEETKREIDYKLEQKADDLINRTFYAELSIIE